MGVGAQEFVPRRVETCVCSRLWGGGRGTDVRLNRPALSDDQAFYSPTPPPGTNGAPKPMTEAGQAETRGGELAEYYDQAMDLVSRCALLAESLQQLTTPRSQNGEYAMHQQQLEMHHQQQLQQEQQMRHPDQQAHYDYNPANPSSGGSTYYASQPFSRQPVRPPLPPPNLAHAPPHSSNTTTTTPPLPTLSPPHSPSFSLPRSTSLSPRNRRRRTRRPRWT